METTKKTVKEKVIDLLNSPMGKDVEVLLAYGINKTGTQADDKALADIEEIAAIIAAKLKSLTIAPTPKQARKAAFNILSNVADKTKTKWDNIILSIIGKFV